MKTKLTEKQNDAEEVGLRIQPMIVRLKQENVYIVVLNHVKYETQNALRAMDILFKVTMALDIQFSIEAKNLLLFLQRQVYEIKTPHDKMSPSISILMKEI